MTPAAGELRERPGRPAATTALALAEAAQQLFLERGFEQTSVRDIALRAGISERTFFRYFATKADVLWVQSPTEVRRFRYHLGRADPGERYEDAIVRSAVRALSFPAELRPWALHRAQLLLTVPAVQNQASVVFTQWRLTASRFAARRSGQPADSIFPIVAGHAVLAGTLAAHQYWVAHPESELSDALVDALTLLLPPMPAAVG